MSIKDFLKEAHRRTGGEKLSPAQQEVHNIAKTIYFGIKGGKTHEWAEEASRMLVQSIAPTISPSDLTEAAASIEGIAMTVLADLFSSGVLIKREAYKDEARKQS